jgi:phosphate transport system ATP-binding protein
MPIQTHNLSTWFHHKKILNNINLELNSNSITALIGSSGCGKSTFLRCLNRMNDRIPGFKMNGKITYKNQDVYHHKCNLLKLRKNIGMVFQRPNVFPASIYDNMDMALKYHFKINKKERLEIIKEALHICHLYDEVKADLNRSAIGLSGGQQQKLCIARAIVIQPEILLLDEPCSALDPISTQKIEEVLVELQDKMSIAIVTHNMAQAQRISSDTAFFMHGEILEYNKTDIVFKNPSHEVTRDYIAGKFG